MTDDFYWYWLCNIKGVANKKIKQLLNVFGNAKDIYNSVLKETGRKLILDIKSISEKDLYSMEQSVNSKELYRDFLNLSNKNIRFIHIESKDYPVKLKNIYDPPFCLYYKGMLPQEIMPCVAIVGSRKCSEYGRQVSENLAEKLAAYGVQTISGLAKGIDSAAHRGTILGKGRTFAVLGCGVDICYPKENFNLYMDIQNDGGIISEYPLGMYPTPGLFPQRNRIISGLADIIIVIEAGEKSGSLITADQALEQNRDVMAVPGRLTDKYSMGCNTLLKQGAQIVTSLNDILENLGIEFKKNVFSQTNGIDKNNIILANEEKLVYANLDFNAKNIDTIIEGTGIEAKLLPGYLLNLELKGFIKEVSKNYYVRTLFDI